MGTKSTPGRPAKRTWRSRLLHYSTRGLLVLVFLVCALLAAYVWLLQDFYEQKEIARELRAGVDCKFDWRSEYDEASDKEPTWFQQWLIDIVGDDPSSQLTTVICYPKDKDQLELVLHAAERLPHLEFLYINGRLSEFRAILGIPRLALSGAFDDKIIQEVGRQESLETLRISNMNTTERVIPDWKPLTNLKKLRGLSLYGSGVTGECLSVIVELKSLERLNLSGDDLGDANYDILKTLPRLRQLTLSGTAITAETIPKLSELKSLEELALNDNDLGDASFDTLKSLPPARPQPTGITYCGGRDP